MLSYNLPDPSEQERVRRSSHEYVSTGDVHGRYKAKPYVRQEYPKVMDKTPCPQLKHFGKKADDFTIVVLEEARKEWDTKQMASIVNNKTEEENWLAAHADDPVLTPGAYPKTMDRTPPPRGNECDGLEDYRQKRQIWRDQIAASIVHDEVEEQLWLEEHQAAQAAKVPTRKDYEEAERALAKMRGEEPPKPKRRGRKPKAKAVAVA